MATGPERHEFWLSILLSDNKHVDWDDGIYGMYDNFSDFES